MCFLLCAVKFIMKKQFSAVCSLPIQYSLIKFSTRNICRVRLSYRSISLNLVIYFIHIKWKIQPSAECDLVWVRLPILTAHGTSSFPYMGSTCIFWHSYRSVHIPGFARRINGKTTSRLDFLENFTNIPIFHHRFIPVFEVHPRGSCCNRDYTHRRTSQGTLTRVFVCVRRTRRIILNRFFLFARRTSSDTHIHAYITYEFKIEFVTIFLSLAHVRKFNLRKIDSFGLGENIFHTNDELVER